MGKLEDYINKINSDIVSAEKANVIKQKILDAKRNFFQENLKQLITVFIPSLNNISKKYIQINEISRKNEDDKFELQLKLDIYINISKNYVNRFCLDIETNLLTDSDNVSLTIENFNVYGKFIKKISFDELLKTDFESVLVDLLSLCNKKSDND